MAELSVSGTRAEFHYLDGVVEWFENRKEGIEHGFILARHPADGPDGEIRLEVQLSGLHATAGDQDDVLILRSDDGIPRLKYAGLKAWDADGDPLTATMSPSPDGIVLAVRSEGARFPVTIDPLITSFEQQLGPEVSGDGSELDQFGQAVALDGTSAVVGAPADDTGGGTDSGSAYVFVRQNDEWILQARLRPADGASGDGFGSSVAIEGDTLVVGSPGDDLGIGKNNAGSAHVFIRSGTNWNPQAVLTSSDGGNQAAFGRSVSVSGDSVLVGASGQQAAFVHVRSGSVWTFQQKLAVTPAASLFGFAVALEGDTALVGAYGVGSSTGAAYVFTRNGGSWALQDTLAADDAAAGDSFGFSVALSPETALIGASHDITARGATGSAYIFLRNGADWSQQAKLLADNGEAGDRFGFAVALDGGRALVGAPLASPPSRRFSGIAYVFVQDGPTWTQEGQLSFGAVGYRHNNIGSSVALDGNLALAGDPAGNTATGLRAGNLPTYRRDTAGTWNLETVLDAGEDAAGDEFGISVAIHGNTAAVGAPMDYNTSTENGSAYVFIRRENLWSLQAKLTMDSSQSSAFFGSAVALDGDTLIVGASGDDFEPSQGNDSSSDLGGSASIYLRSGTTWTFHSKLTPEDGTRADRFGSAIAFEGNLAVFGVPGRGNFKGGACIFTRVGTSWTQTAFLERDGGGSFDHFGQAVALDGTTVLIGAPGAAATGGDTGMAFVHSLQAGTWVLESALEGSNDNGSPDDLRFGSAVAIHGDTALVGAPGFEPSSWVASRRNGSCHFFRRGASGWSFQSKVTAEEGEAAHLFGRTVALGARHAAIGSAPRSTGGDNIVGSVRILSRRALSWQLAKTLPDSPVTAESKLALEGDTLLVGTGTADTINPFNGALTPDTGNVRVFRLSGDEGLLILAFDGDDSETLSPAEWLAIYPKPPKNETLFTSLDRDGSGDISWQELSAARASGGTSKILNGWLLRTDLFASLDTNGDGFVTRQEIRFMWAPGTPAKTVDAYWTRVNGGNGLNLVSWIHAKTLPSISGHAAAISLRAKRQSVAVMLDENQDGLIQVSEFGSLFTAGTPVKKIAAAWAAATATPKGGIAPTSMSFDSFVEAPRLPKLP